MKKFSKAKINYRKHERKVMSRQSRRGAKRDIGHNVKEKIMGICWYCHWGWPKAIKDIYEKALEKLDGNESPLHYGPAHIVWEDENFDSAQWCLDNFDKYSDDLSEEEKAVVRWSLEQLLLVPERIINAQPENYDDKHPENFPPPKDIEWEKKNQVVGK